MSKKISGLISIILLFALLCALFSGCSKTVKDAELRLPLSAQPASLDPQIASGGDSSTVIANCFEGLMRLDEGGNVVKAAAESVSVSSDGLTYIFTLHRDSKWHINTNHEDILGEGYETAIDLDVKADDFVYGLARALNPETKAPDAARLFMIKNAQAINSGKLPVSSLGVVALSDYSVQISLEYPSGELLQALTEPVSMPCSRAFFAATKGRYGLNAACVICNGAFYLSRWYDGTSIVLRRNPDNGHFTAKPSQVTFAFTTDENIILSNLTDAAYAAAPLTAGQVEAAKSAGAQVTAIKNSVWGLLFNCADKAMQHNTLRVALVMATDFSPVRSAATGFAGTATSVIPPSCMLEGKPFTDMAEPVGSLAYNPEKAKGYYENYSKGAMCEVTVLCTPQLETAVRKIIQNWQQTFGISLSAKVEVVEQPELESRVAKGTYQLAFAPIKTDAQTPVEFLYSFKDGANACRFTSKNFNKLLEQLLSAGSTQVMLDGCVQAQNYLIQNAVICPLFYIESYCAAAKNIKNAGFVHSGKTVLLYNAEMLKN